MNSKINFNLATFLLSAPSIDKCPPDIGVEVAFAGRSNAGKSSALNVLTNNSKLSKISKTPGRTQMLNFFKLDNQRRLVDLPGYGYAKVPQRLKRNWQLSLQKYLQKRVSLQGIIVLMDIRHPMMPVDKQMLAWSEYQLPIHILLTKADKLSTGKAQNVFFKVKSQINKEFPQTTISLFSATKKIGLLDLSSKIENWLQENK